MPIEGPIQELGVTDLLQLLCVSRRTGRLDAVDTRTARVVALWLDEGMLVGLSGAPPELRLGRLAALAGAASESEVRRALTRQRSIPSRRVGELLLEQDAIAETEVRRLLRFQIEEAVYDLLRWEDGVLSFSEESPRPGGTIEIRLPTDGVLLDAVRRLDEVTQLTGTLAGNEVVPRLADRAGRRGAPLTLSALEWGVLAEVDGARSLTTLARSLGRQELDVMRALDLLRSAGVVDIRTTGHDAAPGGAAPPAPPERSQSRSSEALLQAAETVAHGRIDEADEQIERILARHPGSAAAHTLKGIVMERGGAQDGAGHFHRAIELDPLHEDAYFHLATTLVKRGDLGGARREIETFLALASPDHPRRRRAEILLAGLIQTLDALEERA